MLEDKVILNVVILQQQMANNAKILNEKLLGNPKTL